MKKIIGLLLICVLPYSVAMADKNYELNNKSNYTLKFDKTWQATPKCSVTNKTSEVSKGSSVRFDIDQNEYDNGCTWGGVGYKVYNSDGSYKDYLSINVSSAGKSNWNYSYTFGKTTSCGQGSSCDFYG